MEEKNEDVVSERMKQNGIPEMEESDRKNFRILYTLIEYLKAGRIGVQDFPVDDVITIMDMAVEDLEVFAAEFKEGEPVEKEAWNYQKVLGAAANAGSKKVLAEALELAAANLLEITYMKKDKQIALLCSKFAQRFYLIYGDHAGKKENLFQGRGVVYTAVTGGYNKLRDPEYIDPQMDYICFTDQEETESAVWQIRKIENPEGLDQTRLARRHKILCHQYLPEYDYSIYIDGKMMIRGDMKKYIETYSRGKAMLCFPHFLRDCAYEEAKVCITAKKDDQELIYEQMRFYCEEGFPKKAGLIDSACLVRRHHDRELNRVLESWWTQVRDRSRRDQLSLGYVCWKQGFTYDICNLYIYANEYTYLV